LRLAFGSIRRSPALPRAFLLDSLLYVLSTEIALGEQAIVRSAQYPQVASFGASASRPRLLVVDLQEGARRAMLTVCRHVTAAEPIARQHLASRCVPQMLSCLAPAPSALGDRVRRTYGRRASSSGAIGFAKACFLQMLDQQIEPSLDHERQLTARIRVTHQISRELELCLQLRARIQLNPITSRRQLLDALRRAAATTQPARQLTFSAWRAFSFQLELSCGRTPANSVGQLAHERGCVGSRKSRRDQRLDLAPRFAAGFAEQQHVIFFAQVIAQQTHTREVDLTLLEQLENHRETPPQPRPRDAPPRFVLTQTELPQAVVEQRRIPSFQVQPPRLDLSQMRQNPGFCPTPQPNELSQARHHFTISNARQLPEASRHSSLLTRPFLSAHAGRSFARGKRATSSTVLPLENASTRGLAALRARSSALPQFASEHPQMSSSRKRRKKTQRKAQR
jgi:hypothetical protein